MPLGPFDKRVQRKRCTECRSRHLKCNGSPCHACLSGKRKCVPPTPKRRQISLEMVPEKRPKPSDSNFTLCFPATPSTITSMQPDLNDRFVTYFYSSFLETNNFTGKSNNIYLTLPSLLRTSPTLSNVAMAVSSLSLERQQGSVDRANTRSLQFYRESVRCLQSELNDSDLIKNQSILWSTFFLGIFELMYDTSGDGWVKHFLYGTSKILQHFGPEACLSGIGRQFFLTIRIFEISRSLIFNQSTFLSDAAWHNLMSQMWSDPNVDDWHPKEALFNIMISCAELGARGYKLKGDLMTFPEESRERMLRDFAAQGLLLQEALRNWETSIQSWHSISEGAEDDQMTLSLTFHNAVTIYLSGLFDYYDFWEPYHIPTPVISSSEVQERLVVILSNISLALTNTNLAGVLFMFPLRVAGARARTPDQRGIIAKMLEDISNRGFVVAGAFIADLKQVWEERPMDIGD